MKRSKLVALLAALAVMMTAAVAPATAQEDNSTDTPTTPTETPTPTPDDSDDDESNETTTSTSTSTEDDDDGVVRVQASGDSGGSDFIIDLGNNDEIDTSSVMYTMGPEVTIHDAEYHPDREEMHIDITVNRPNGATLSYIDLSGAKASEEDVGGRIPTIDAPEGTHRLKIPAGSYDGKSRVSLSGLGYYHTVTATAPSDSFLDDQPHTSTLSAVSCCSSPGSSSTSPTNSTGNRTLVSRSRWMGRRSRAALSASNPR